MKLEVFCIKCFPLCKLHRPNKYYKINIQDTQVYSLKCEHGHETTIGMQQSKFELLFELGCHAAADGYYREAISSFAAALERFYEILIRSVLYEQKIPEQVIESMWKPLSNSSERQLGAYISLFTISIGSPPPLLNEKSVNLRNRAVHKGYIPTRAETISYGQQVLNLIKSNEEAIRGKLETGINEALMNEYFNSTKGLDLSNGYQSSIYTLIVFSVNQNPTPPRRDLDTHIRLLEQIREMTTTEMPAPGPQPRIV
jgi:hypothetical protein